MERKRFAPPMIHAVPSPLFTCSQTSTPVPVLTPCTSSVFSRSTYRLRTLKSLE